MPVLSLACHLPHNTPHIPSRYNNEQTTKQTKAINNSYIYINISCKCDTNRAGHFTLDAYASRPVACPIYTVLTNFAWPPSAFNDLFNNCCETSTWHAYQPPYPLQWRHNGRDGVSNHQPYDCLPNRLFRGRSQKSSKLRITGLCVGNSPVAGEFPAKRASKVENASIWWRHYATDWSSDCFAP